MEKGCGLEKATSLCARQPLTVASALGEVQGKRPALPENVALTTQLEPPISLGRPARCLDVWPGVGTGRLRTWHRDERGKLVHPGDDQAMVPECQVPGR